MGLGRLRRRDDKGPTPHPRCGALSSLHVQQPLVGELVDAQRALSIGLVDEIVPAHQLATRVDAIVTWFLDVVSRHSRSWLAAITAGGMAGDTDVDRVIAEAVDRAADAVLQAVGPAAPGPALHAMARSYVGLAVSTAREWLQRGVLTRDQVHRLLAATLLTMVEQVFADA